MKYPILQILIIVVIISAGCNQKKQNSTTELIYNPITADNQTELTDLPKIQFDKVEHDFGLLMQGEKVTYTFTFKNTGKQDLIIKDATASCGCTVPKFTTKPIAPGEKGEIEVIFDSSNRNGRQVKSITVWTNCQPNQTKIQILSEIVEPK